MSHLNIKFLINQQNMINATFVLYLSKILALSVEDIFENIHFLPIFC